MKNKGTKYPIQLLAPAGNWDSLKAAVANGADAIYFGVEKFNARARADNFRMEELPEIMAYLHLYGVRGYLTFNILVFEDELADAQGISCGLYERRRRCSDCPGHGAGQIDPATVSGFSDSCLHPDDHYFPGRVGFFTGFRHSSSCIRTRK